MAFRVGDRSWLGISVGRALSYIAAGWIGLLIVASFSAMAPLPRPWLPLAAPNLALLVVLFVGLAGRADLSMVVGLSCFLGYLADLIAGAPKGVHILAYGLVGFVVRAASSRLMVRGTFAISLVAGFFGAAFALLVVLERAALQMGFGLGLLRRVPLEAVATAVVAPLAFRALTRLDGLFTRREPSRALKA